jgi:hypothetical protein
MHRLSPVFAAILFFVAAALGTSLPLSARAAEGYDNCTGFIDTVPATVTTPGTWCLRHDLNTAITEGTAITIATSNVTLDCNHFKIDGLAGGTGVYTNGVSAGDRFNVSIRNCNIRGFLRGIHLGGYGGGGHMVEHNTLDGNTIFGISVNGPGSTIRDNRVLDTGESTAVGGNAYGINAWNGVDVIDNTVNGVVPTRAETAHAIGIATVANGAGSVIGNRVRGLAPIGHPTAMAYGVYNVNSRGLIIRDNNLQGPGALGVGLRCSSTPATARDNVIAGFATAVERCMSVGNTVNTY